MTTQPEKTDILLVDDRPENLLSLESLLDGPDLRFIRALSGEEALEAALRSSPACVLLDVQMPGMDGFEVARLLRSVERTRNIPIIFVTATRWEEKFTFQGFESGAVDYLFKPLNPIVVRNKVRVFVELHRNRLNLENTVRHLSLINRELESFSYSVSHDLRAPVRAIIGFTQAAMEQMTEEKDAERKEHLLRVLGAADRMNQLIDALLDLARVTGSELRKESVDLSSVARQICEELQREHPDRNFEFQVESEAVVGADKRLVESILRNLLSNASKFTAKNTASKISFGVQQQNNGKVFFVRDNGVGFDMKYANRLFGVFQRLHRDDEFPGTGVGLATVQRIVHRHGGKIWAESEKQSGATFFFTL